MLRGSRPGERRGGRDRGTPNRRTILRDRILAIGSDHSGASQRAVLRKLLKDEKLPAETRIAIAPQCFPAKRSYRTAGGRTTIAREARAAKGAAGTSTGSSQTLIPAMRDWTPQALEALFGVVQDVSANPRARRKAALKIAEFLLPKVGKKPKVLPDEYGFLISPKLAIAYRDIQLELRGLKSEPTRKIPAIAANIEKLEARSAPIGDRVLAADLVQFAEHDVAETG